MEATPPLESEPRAEEALIPLGPVVAAIVTHYGAHYNGQTLGCGTGVYDSDDATIIAVGPARDRQWSCGTLIQVCGTVGCIMALRQDSCPGCDANHVDLSEAGITAVCGEGVSLCDVHLQVFTRVQVPPDTVHHGDQSGETR
jgi:hypothetical protein